MHDLLFQNTRKLGAAQLPGYAKSLGLDMTAFGQCLESGKHEAEVRQDMADGRAAGVRGTPTFFLAVAGDEPGTLKTLSRIRGAHPFATFKQAIDAALAKIEKEPAAKQPKPDKQG